MTGKFEQDIPILITKAECLYKKQINQGENNFQESSSILDQILKIKPNSITALLQKVTILLRENQIINASKLIDKILNIDPNNVDGLYLKRRLFNNTK